jgi:hypothetical protein
MFHSPSCRGSNPAGGEAHEVPAPEFSMWIPAVRERVKVRGEDDVFLIVGVDHFRELVDMISTTGIRPMIENVPFEFLNLVSEQTPKA